MTGNTFPLYDARNGVFLLPVSTNVCNAHLQEVEEFVKKVNGNGGQFELHVYDDAGHAFLTSDEHRESKFSRQAQTLVISACTDLLWLTARVR